jgi:hypothetical protein
MKNWVLIAVVIAVFVGIYFVDMGGNTFYLAPPGGTGTQSDRDGPFTPLIAPYCGGDEKPERRYGWGPKHRTSSGSGRGTVAAAASTGLGVPVSFRLPFFDPVAEMSWRLTPRGLAKKNAEENCLENILSETLEEAIAAVNCPSPEECNLNDGGEIPPDQLEGCEAAADIKVSSVFGIRDLLDYRNMVCTPFDDPEGGGFDCTIDCGATMEGKYWCTKWTVMEG